MSITLAADGSSLFMRALHILPEDKRTADDLEFMVVGMFRKAMRAVRATHGVIMLDSVEANWRAQQFPGYKGDREYDGLRPRQLTPILRPRFEARGIPVGYRAGLEADDLLAAVAERCKSGSEVFIYTKDSDLYAVLKPETGVRLLWPEKEGKFTAVDRDAATEALGFEPAWLPMVRALTADRKDNIRGIFGDPPPQRVPVNKPRAALLLKAYEGHLWECLDANAEGKCEVAKSKEAAWLKEKYEEIVQAWQIASLRPEMPPLDARLCSVGHMNLSLPHGREE